MYKMLHSAIREHDDNHIILFEPTIITTSVSCRKNCLEIMLRNVLHSCH